MTETEWLACTNPLAILEFLRGRASDRKLRLAAFAFVRRIWNHLSDERLKTAIAVSERHADGKASNADLAAAIKEAHRVRFKHNALARAAYEAARYHPQCVETSSVAMHASRAAGSFALPAGMEVSPTAIGYFDDQSGKWVTEYPAPNLGRQIWDAAKLAEDAAQAQVLREIVGNPFCPTNFDPTWRTPEVISLAQMIYDGRSFNRMPELADTLGGAGCTNPDILAHCHQSGEHVRGCWVVDLILDKR